MKKIILSCISLVTVLVITSCTNTEKAETAVAELEGVTGKVSVNKDSSNVIWKGEMLGLYGHEGTVKLTEGNLDVENGVVKSGNFVVDLATINPTDNGYDAENTKEKLVGHLSSDDFFNTSSFPTASFVVTSAEGNDVSGNLTIRGITNPETVKNVVVSEENGVVKATGELTFDRTKYDVKFSTGVQEKVLSNDIVLTINLVGTK